MRRVADLRAFSLVELSIVLVILGLLVGGVLAGRSLIQAAELRTVLTQHRSYYSATQTFKQKYLALPGDITNATAIWGIAAGTGSDGLCGSTASTDSKTCNGNGNGKVFPHVVAENFRFWQHLANAGLIEGTYNGDLVPESDYATSNYLPAGKVRPSFWVVKYIGDSTNITDPANYEANESNGMFLGAYNNAMWLEAAWPSTGLLTPEEQLSLDTKADDGKPGRGSVVVYNPDGLLTCTTAAAIGLFLNGESDVNADYNTATKDPACNIVFRQQF